jgi:hypothetical protein
MRSVHYITYQPHYDEPFKNTRSLFWAWCKFLVAMDQNRFTRAVCKVRGLTLLFRVVTLWRCGVGLFFEVPPLASDELLTTLHLLLENGLTVVLKEPFSGWRSNLSGVFALRDWKVAMDALTEIGGTPLEHPPYSPDLASCQFWTFPTMKRELRG